MNALQSVLDFAARLDAAKISYDIAIHRDDMLMFTIAVPGERWEVEFGADGRIETEVFRSDRGIDEEVDLEELFERFSD